MHSGIMGHRAVGWPKAIGIAAILVFIYMLQQSFSLAPSYDRMKFLDALSSSNDSDESSVTQTTTVYSVVTVAISTPESPKPTSTSVEFPKKVWQTGPKPITQDTRDKMETWFEHNPSYRHEVLSDDGGDQYVMEKYAHRPDILELYLNLKVPILKADLLRYLILLADGGVWSDLDVSCQKPIDEWIPAWYKDKVNMVVGLEFDQPFPGEGQRLASQLTNWVFMAKPGLKHLSVVVDDIVEDLRSIADENKVDYSGLKKIMLSDVVDVTGPKRMTLSLVKSLTAELGELIDDRNISSIKRPVLVGDVLVLPTAAFAASQGGYPKDQGAYLVTHHYAGSWKHDDEEIAQAKKAAAEKKQQEEEQQKKEEEKKKDEDRKKEEEKKNQSDTKSEEEKKKVEEEERKKKEGEKKSEDERKKAEEKKAADAKSKEEQQAVGS
jgi:mannan polymerase II complex HOC1 subunit